MTKEEFLRKALLELYRIKKFASKDELELLSIEDFRPSNVHRCIYGMMTGHCRSKRAAELLAKCCSKSYLDTTKISFYGDTMHFEDLQETNLISKTNFSYLSYVELLIMAAKSSTNKKIINFLKGKLENLTIEDLVLIEVS